MFVISILSLVVNLEHCQTCFKKTV